MAHTSYGELRQLFETFTRVWGSGGQSSLHLHTQDDKSTATLHIQLGPPAAPRPGAPDARSASHPPPPTSASPPPPPSHSCRPRHRGPAQRERNRQRAARPPELHKVQNCLIAGFTPTVLP